jgi:hypothetical protein
VTSAIATAAFFNYFRIAFGFNFLVFFCTLSHFLITLPTCTYSFLFSSFGYRLLFLLCKLALSSEVDCRLSQDTVQT